MSHQHESWFGSTLPSGWGTTSVRAAFKEKTDRSGESLDNYLSLTANAGVIPYAEKGDVGNKAPEDMSKCKKVSPGDFVLNSMNFGIGSFGVSGDEGVCSSVYLVLQPNSEKFNSHYLKRIFELSSFQTYAQSLGNGILAHRAAFGWDKLRNVPLPLPPRAEQDAIVEFLDRELEQIDALIAKNEELVTNLLARRKALIASLITFGSASSKAVPNHWTPQRLRHLATIESGRDYKEVEVFEGGYPIYGSGGEFGRASRYLYSGESVLLGRKGTIDRPLYVNEAFWTVDTMYWTRFKPGVCIKFMYYWATTIPFKMYSTNTALPSMTGADLKNMPINLPPLDEQIAIATELDEAIQGMDILQENSEKSVSLLKERRQALIASAVTGKLELQGAS